jgi:hypothetical protein
LTHRPLRIARRPICTQEVPFGTRFSVSEMLPLKREPSGHQMLTPDRVSRYGCATQDGVHGFQRLAEPNLAGLGSGGPADIMAPSACDSKPA